MREGRPVHWLSYSNADQALLRDPELDDAWDGLVVPGTLATFYFDGTGGFVLTRGRSYVIDPRTPLLQEITVARPQPRRSHLAIAAVHDPEVPAVWPSEEIRLSYWRDGRWPDVVERVLDFQRGYSSQATAKIDKYARLLAEATGRSLALEPDPPHRLVPPYWAVTGPDDPWWELSRDATSLAFERYASSDVMPILATTRETPVRRFAELLGDLPGDCRQVFCWRGSWDEAEATRDDIRGWVETINQASAYDLEVTNLYGGYLSVLLTAAGLGGLNHGVGYSESRDVRRLGATGAPPTRYYVPALRAFVPRASAQPVLDSLPTDWVCDCSVCQSASEAGVPVIESLSSEDLKRHFLICRHREILRVEADIDGELDTVEEVARWLANRTFTGAIPSGAAARLSVWALGVREAL